MTSTVWAQKKNTATAQKKEASTKAPTLTAEQLIQNYRFSEAAKSLQTQIDNAREAGKPTERLEADLRRANLGSDMVRGTEKVIFIDSVKVPRAQMLSAIRLSSTSGSLVQSATVAKSVKSLPSSVGTIAYINELGDRVYFSATDSAGGVKTISSAYKSGNGWGTPAPLEGMESEDSDQDYPFVMPDGVTLYFASQGEGSLGGYDVFVTRYNPETKQYLKADNLGMPFNSPANDYMIAIDEDANLGWLVTDRNQSADTVCVYVFVPSESREVYDLLDYSISDVVNIASLKSIALTQTDSEQVKAAKARLATVRQTAATSASSKQHRRYVISDAKVYTSLSQFRSNEARAKAKEADKTADELSEALSQQDELQLAVAQGSRNKQTLDQLKQLNYLIPQLKSQYNTLCKEMRQAEAK